MNNLFNKMKETLYLSHKLTGDVGKERKDSLDRRYYKYRNRIICDKYNGDKEAYYVEAIKWQEIFIEKERVIECKLIDEYNRIQKVIMELNRLVIMLNRRIKRCFGKRK